MNDHPESFPDPEEEPPSVAFEEVVKGLEGLGADVEREAAEKAERERAREQPPGDQDEPASPFAGMQFPGPEQLQQLLGALGLGGGEGEGQTPDLANLAKGLGAQIPGLDPQMLAMVMGRIQSLINSGEGPVNWALAKDIARGTSAATPDPSPTSGELGALADAVRLAEHWLDAVCDLPAGTTGALAWSRAEWIEQTLPVWKRLVEPVAQGMTAAMTGMLPGPAAEMAGPMGAMLQQMAGTLFGHQVGTALAELAGEVLGSSDIGLPLGPEGKAVLLPANVAAFGAGLELPAADVRLYLALREAAYHRLFAHVPWLSARVLGAVEEYARGISVDEGRMEETMRSLQSPEGMANLQDILGENGLTFTAPDTPAQRAALTRLETLLALTEGWVDAVVDAAAAPKLPGAGALRETFRRRRAAGGPAEQTFAALVGLELRPRRLRDAARLWTLLGEARGSEGRDALWAHPDLLPTAEDLSDPAGFVQRRESDLEALGKLMENPPEDEDPDTGDGNEDEH
ncbi:zinc-dependent metalloprotease [Actinospica robiniae]|uniref:zinc-dependent metalloprotease n=1 Tax=Actinospica robiniae TaxID=304901 RepID=UPI00040206C3|nr:zinc-dependent metalloprotease [Actinospica robiniae]